MPLTTNNILWMIFVFVIILFFIVTAWVGESKNGWNTEDDE